jgi:hypothetical protein
MYCLILFCFHYNNWSIPVFMHLHFTNISTVIAIVISVYGMCKFVQNISCPFAYCLSFRSASNSVCEDGYLLGFYSVFLVDIDWCSRGTYCLHHQGNYWDERNSKHIWSIGQYLPDYTVQHPRRQPSSHSSYENLKFQLIFVFPLTVLTLSSIFQYSAWSSQPCVLVAYH